MAQVQLQVAFNGDCRFRTLRGEEADLEGFNISWLGYDRTIFAKVNQARTGVLGITDRPHTARFDDWPDPAPQVPLSKKVIKKIEVTASLTRWAPHGPDSFRAQGMIVKVQFPPCPKGVGSVVCLTICFGQGTFKGTWEGLLPSDPPNSPLRPLPPDAPPPLPYTSLLELLNPKYIAALVEDVQKSQELDRFPVSILLKQLKISGVHFRACTDSLSDQLVSDQEGHTPQLQEWDRLRFQIYHLVSAIRKKRGNIPVGTLSNIEAGIRGFAQLSSDTNCIK